MTAWWTLQCATCMLELSALASAKLICMQASQLHAKGKHEAHEPHDRLRCSGCMHEGSRAHLLQHRVSRVLIELLCGGSAPEERGHSADAKLGAARLEVVAKLVPPHRLSTVRALEVCLCEEVAVLTDLQPFILDPLLCRVTSTSHV